MNQHERINELGYKLDEALAEDMEAVFIVEHLEFIRDYEQNKDSKTRADNKKAKRKEKRLSGKG